MSDKKAPLPNSILNKIGSGMSPSDMIKVLVDTVSALEWQVMMQREALTGFNDSSLDEHGHAEADGFLKSFVVWRKQKTMEVSDICAMLTRFKVDEELAKIGALQLKTLEIRSHL